uniref:non-specific serine/threonine protein kinase n=1 Tax=Parascaris equorum TaxID=6256 RepID=A0A914RW63_PAREQ
MSFRRYGRGAWWLGKQIFLRIRGVGAVQRFSPRLVRYSPEELFLANIRYNPSLMDVELPGRLDAYEIGSNIACGCHAAVYELCLRTTSECCDRAASTSSIDQQQHIMLNEHTRDPLIAYPLALKIMFNYQFDAPERYLWADMGAELIPLVDANRLLKGRLPTLRTLPRSHPNIIKIYTAFTDRMPVLADARSLYPEALPNANFYELIIDEPRTLFIVMKRYRMTLREYMLTMKRNYWTARVMFGQLLEAIVFLYEHTISHRDMKSDNILLDFDHPEEVPHLVLSDFGCALATGTWMVSYPDDTVDLGGNLALRAPEESKLRASNPFYSRMKSCDYVECELPKLPAKVHYAIKALIKDMLWRDPTKRPDPRVAANVLSISLFRFGDDVRSFLSECGFDETIIGCGKSTLKNLESRAEAKLDEMVMLYAAETILAKRLEGKVISTAELQVHFPSSFFDSPFSF